MKIVRFDQDGSSIEVSPVGKAQEGHPFVEVLVSGIPIDGEMVNEISVYVPVSEARELASYITQMADVAESL